MLFMKIHRIEQRNIIPKNSPDTDVLNWGFIFRAAEDQIFNLYPKYWLMLLHNNRMICDKK